jgi:hypothetical protein
MNKATAADRALEQAIRDDLNKESDGTVPDSA